MLTAAIPVIAESVSTTDRPSQPSVASCHGGASFRFSSRAVRS